jgi:7-cyano-7-deazaguanine synthase
MGEKKKAVVLSSGGIDSTTAMAIAKDQGFELYSLTFDYGQRHACEIEAAKRIAAALTAEKHLILKLDLGKIGGSALTSDRQVPKDRDVNRLSEEIPATYVPARNTIFLAHALAWAEVIGAFDIFIGVSAVDYSGYPDCRPEFIEAFEHMAALATKAAVTGKISFKIRTPLIHMTKARIIQKGTSLGIDYALTHSCYDPSPGGSACGRCDSCLLRRKGFQEAGIPDPTAYDR